MKILLCPDSYKGSFEAMEVANAMEEGILRVFPEAQICKLPIADGGEGTTESLVSATGGKFFVTEVHDPLGKKRKARWGILGDGSTAVMEMAEASGLPFVPKELRNPLITSTYGTGEMIRAALDLGCRNFIMGIGGSATNDGGAGMIEALGGRFLDADKKKLSLGGDALKNLARIDLSEMDSRLKESFFLVACDVDNSLTGKRGASVVYGPQKGATPEMIISLDQALKHYGEIAKETTGRDCAKIPGAGAAGGLGAAFLFFLNCELRSGVEIVLETLKFDDHIANTDWALTGEGQTDFQTAHGKAPVGVAARAAKYGVPTLCLSGGLGENYQAVLSAGIRGIKSIVSRPEMSLEECMTCSHQLIADASEQISRFIQIGYEIRQEKKPL